MINSSPDKALPVLVSSPSQMMSLESSLQAASNSSSPRISFSSEFLDENNFISICPNPQAEVEEEAAERERARARAAARNAEFEFLSAGNMSSMMAADELFCEGKLLPFWQMQHMHVEKLNKISLKSETNAEADGPEETARISNKEEARISWFLDDDPSPRPPKCTVLWKELLRLKKPRSSSTLSPSSSSSSSSSRSSSLAEIPTPDQRKEGERNKDKAANKRIKKGQERTRTNTIRIRPMINVPICTQAKISALPPLFSARKGKLER